MGFYKGPKIITDGLVLYMDAGNVNSYPRTGNTWNDISGKGNTGTFINGPYYDPINNGCIVFDGIDDYVDITTIPNLTNPLTICTFVNTSVVTGNNQIIYGPSANGSDNWISITNNKVQLTVTELSDLNNFNIVGDTIILPNTWYYIVGVIDNNVISLYVNGVFEKSSTPQTFTVGNWVSTARIGQRPLGQYPFNGKIATIQGYNRVLTPQEILQNYNATKGRFNL